MSDRPYDKGRDLIEGLQILRKYGILELTAGHDVLFASPRAPTVAEEVLFVCASLLPEDIEALLAAGWTRDGDVCSCPRGQHLPTCKGWCLRV